VRLNGSKENFWSHEWTKHGTCALQLEPLNTELKYFSKGKKTRHFSFMAVSHHMSGSIIIPTRVHHFLGQMSLAIIFHQ
jgi:hypothetical protein